MADLSITVSEMRIDQDSRISKKQVGEAVTPGQPLYEKQADGKHWKAVATGQAEVKADCIAWGYGAADDWVPCVETGTIDPGAACTEGVPYVVSANAAGAIAPHSDLTSDDWVTELGYGDANGDLVLDIASKDVQIA